MTTPASPQVYKAISAVTAAFARDGIAKLHTNIRDQYQYRSIDDLLNRLGPLLARYRLCVLPRVLKHRTATVAGEGDTLLTNVRLLAAFDLVSARDGSCHTDANPFAGHGSIARRCPAQLRTVLGRPLKPRATSSRQSCAALWHPSAQRRSRNAAWEASTPPRFGLLQSAA